MSLTSISSPSLSKTAAVPNAAPLSDTSLEMQRDMVNVLPTTVDQKDVRAYEHERSRRKKTAEFLNTKARKELLWTTGAVLNNGPSRKEKRLSAKSLVHAGDLKGTMTASEAELYGVFEPAFPRSAYLPSKGGEYETKLMDLVTTKKQRKGRDHDFEIIPHVRSVIVLDDFKVDTQEIDEPWEHISSDESDDDEKAKGLSYADIVSVSK